MFIGHAGPTVMDRRTLLKYLAALPLSAHGLAQDLVVPAAVDSPSNLESLKEKIRSLANRSRSLRLFYPKGSFGNLVPCVAAFELMTGIKVHLIEASLDEISSQMILDHRLNRAEPYDIALPPTFSIPDLAEAGVITPLNEFCAKHEPPGFLNNALYNLGDRFLGNFYGYQADGDAYLLFMNKEWLQDPGHQARYADAFGQRLEVPATWDEVDRQMQFFHTPTQNRYGGTLFRSLEYTVWEFWVRLHSKGIWPFDRNMTPQIEHPASLEALQELIRATSYLSADVTQNGLFENFKSYGQGNKYCNLGWGGTQKYLQGPESKLKDKLLHVPLPGGRVGSQSFSVPYFNWGWNYVVLQQSKQKELAYLFCLFASAPSISTLAIQDNNGFFDPHRREHYDDATIQNIYSKDFLNAHLESMKNAIPDLYIQGYNLYMSALKHAIHSCIVYNIQPSLALKKVALRWNELTDKLGRNKQVEQWRYLQSSYPAFLRKILG
jgi:multiple sugar transport system substrate-binding protein